MTPGARLAAAAEILAEIFARKFAADRTIVAWGRAHRFAGSKDRAAIAERVYTVLRRRNECAFAAGGDSARALVLGSLAVADALDVDGITALSTDGAHALGAVTADERKCLAEHGAPPTDQPWIRLNYPSWLHEELVAAFGKSIENEIQALNARAPLDLRVNALAAKRDDAMRELVQAGLAPAPITAVPDGLRLEAGSDAKVTTLAAYREGRVEIQDEASQRAVLLAGTRPGDTVIDLAAGAGGKALALAAAVQNRGRVLACDVEPARLRQMEPRIARSSAKVIEIVGDPYGGAIAAAAGEGADLVFVDAPCSSTGTWRRNPEAKWLLDPARLGAYRGAQKKLLDRAAELAGPRGRIAYAVCSVLPSEGDEQIAGFTARHSGWRARQTASWTPARDNTDGFFVAILERVDA